MGDEFESEQAEDQGTAPTPSVEKTKEGLIWKIIGGTDHSLDRLEKCAHRLKKRLEPVSKSDVPDDQDKKEEEEAGPAVAQRLRKQRRRIQLVNRLLDYIMDQLEI